MVIVKNAVPARCERGRFLMPAERAAVIRKLAMEALGLGVAMDTTEQELRSLRARARMKSRELAVAERADAALRAIGR